MEFDRVLVMLIQPSVTEKVRARTTVCSLDGMPLALWMDASECFKRHTALN